MTYNGSNERDNICKALQGSKRARDQRAGRSKGSSGKEKGHTRSKDHSRRMSEPTPARGTFLGPNLCPGHLNTCAKHCMQFYFIAL